jgi:hypothetical protein
MVAEPTAKTIQGLDNEGGAPSMAHQCRKESKDEKSFSSDFLEHPGSVGEMHFSYDNRKKLPRDAAEPNRV